MGYGTIYGLIFGSIILGIILVIIEVIAYVFSSLGLFNAAKKRSMQYPWMAWVPFLRDYLIGTMLKNELIVTPKLRIPYIQYILPVAMALAGITRNVFSGIFWFIYVVLSAGAYICLFRQYKEKNAILYGILAGIPVVHVVGSFFIYQLGTKDAPDPGADSTAFPVA
jgi:hypothetical protein